VSWEISWHINTVDYENIQEMLFEVTISVSVLKILDNCISILDYIN